MSICCQLTTTVIGPFLLSLTEADKPSCPLLCRSFVFFRHTRSPALQTRFFGFFSELFLLPWGMERDLEKSSTRSLSLSEKWVGHDKGARGKNTPQLKEFQSSLNRPKDRDPRQRIANIWDLQMQTWRSQSHHILHRIVIFSPLFWTSLVWLNRLKHHNSTSTPWSV